MIPMRFERAAGSAVAEGEAADGAGLSDSERVEVGIESNGSEPAGLKQPGPAARHVVHGVPEAISSLLRTVVVALFVLTFLAQPMVIPSESMERTLLVGDFLLMNRSALAPVGFWQRIFPKGGVQRGEIVTFHSPLNPKEYLIKRVIGLPGDRLRIDNGRVFVNEQLLDERYAAFEPATANPYLDHFPTTNYTDPAVEPGWWRQLQQDTRGGELVIPTGEYFMLGDNRNHSLDSRFWGFVERNQIVARTLVIYFSLNRPSRTDVQKVAEASDDRLGTHWKEFARWDRIFRVVH